MLSFYHKYGTQTIILLLFINKTNIFVKSNEQNHFTRDEMLTVWKTQNNFVYLQTGRDQAVSPRFFVKGVWRGNGKGIAHNGLVTGRNGLSVARDGKDFQQTTVLSRASNGLVVRTQKSGLAENFTFFQLLKSLAFGRKTAFFGMFLGVVL